MFEEYDNFNYNSKKNKLKDFKKFINIIYKELKRNNYKPSCILL